MAKLPDGKKKNFMFSIPRFYMIESYIINFCCQGYKFGLNTNLYINIFSFFKKKKKKLALSK